MEKQIITFSANEQCLQKTGGIDCYASNIVSYIEARFELGDNWSGYDSVRAVWFTDFVSGISTVLDSDGVCIVPHEVLTRKSAVKVNLVGSIAENDVLTDRLTTCPVIALTIKCNAKTDGDNTQPITPSEYEQFVQAVKADADRAEDAKDSARVYAGNALSSAQNALVSETNASTSETNAHTSEVNARASEDNAKISELSASASAESASEDAGRAENAKDAVLGMRAEATTLEPNESATASYSDGVLTLGIPKGVKGDRGQQGIQGETGATPNFTIGTVETLEPTEDATATITGTAEEPILNLGIPKGEQGDVNLSQLEALLPTETASGEIVTITDGQSVVPAKSLKVALEPIQDLHGYDKPWAAGAGKNKLSDTRESGNTTISGVTFTTNSDGSVTMNGTATGTIYYNLILRTAPFNLTSGEYIVSGLTGSSAQIVVGNAATNTAIGNTSNMQSFTLLESLNVFAFIQIANGTTINNITAYPMIRLASETDATYAPYSNICPISGRTEVVTSRVGKNLFDESIFGTLSGWTETDGTYTGNSNQFVNSFVVLSDVPAETQVTFSFEGIVNGSTLRAGYVWIDYTDGTHSYLAFIGNTWNSYALTSTASKSVAQIRFADSSGLSISIRKAQIELGSTATAYEPYIATTYTTTLGRTVYGGTLDVVSGVLTVDRAMETFDGAEGWFKSGSALNGFYHGMGNAMKPNGLLVADKFEYTPNVQTYFQNYGVCYSDYSVNFNVDPSIIGGTTIEDWKAWLANNPLQVVYELATPQTYQLTPQEVQLLLGTNNVWSDGNVTLVYSADIQKWVEKKLNANSTTSMLTMSRPMVQTETTETEETETETETAETE